jgi:hypothetical protein
MNTGGSIITQLIGPGQTYNSSCAGNQFYVVACPGTVNINAGTGMNPFYQGTGLDVGAEFNLIQIQNPSKNQIVVQIYIGYDSFIDKRQLPIGPLEVPVIVSTTIMQGSPFTEPVKIPDQSGLVIKNATDGLNYFLVQRTSINFLNTSQDLSGNAFSVGLSTGPNGNALSSVTSIPSARTLTQANGGFYPLVIEAPGNFWLVPEGVSGAFEVTVYEIYQGILVPGQ